MLIGFTHLVSPHIASAEITFIDRQPINYELAVQQHHDYCAALSSCGVAVKKLSVNLSNPDSCFIEDTALIVDDLAIITSMGSVSRRNEPKALAPELARYCEIVQLQLPVMLEGGDVLRIGKKLFVGLSSRTNIQGVEALAQILEPRGYDIVPIKLNNSLHLKTACTTIDDQTLLMNPQWIEPEPLAHYKVLTTPEDEPWAANTLRIGDTVFLQAGFPKTIELVSQQHDQVEVLDISEFRKAEAGLSCLSLILPNAT